MAIDIIKTICAAYLFILGLCIAMLSLTEFINGLDINNVLIVLFTFIPMSVSTIIVSIAILKTMDDA